MTPDQINDQLWEERRLNSMVEMNLSDHLAMAQQEIAELRAALDAERATLQEMRKQQKEDSDRAEIWQAACESTRTQLAAARSALQALQEAAQKILEWYGPSSDYGFPTRPFWEALEASVGLAPAPTRPQE